MKAPTPAPRSVSTDVYGWSFAALPSPRTLGCWPAASTNTMSRFETEVLTQDSNVEGLDRLNAEWVDGAMSPERTP